MRLIAHSGFSKTSVFGKSTLDLSEKLAIWTVFRKPFPKLTEFWKRLHMRKLAYLFVYKSIRFYQYAISPHFPPCCRYVPTCSNYAYEAVQKYGICRGLFLALKRLLRCHPFHSGGYDPLR